MYIYTAYIYTSSALRLYSQMAASSDPIDYPAKYEDLYDQAYPHLDLEQTTEAQGLCGVCACPSHSNGADVSWAQCRTVLGMAAALDEAVGEVFDGLKASGRYENSVIVCECGRSCSVVCLSAMAG